MQLALLVIVCLYTAGINSCMQMRWYDELAHQLIHYPEMAQL